MQFIIISGFLFKLIIILGIYENEEIRVRGARRGINDNTVESEDSIESDKIISTRNNLILNKNDEILAANDIADSDTSSLNSYLPRQIKMNRTTANVNRARNAKKFLDQFEKAKQKVIKNRTAQVNLKPVKKSKNTKRMIIEDKSENDLSTGAEGRSSFNAEDDLCEAKNLKEKYLKEIRKQRLMDIPNLEGDSDPKLIKGKPNNRIRYAKTSNKKKNLNIDYEDLNRKDNYIFFEVLATYVDSYLDDDQRKNANLEQLVQQNRK